MWSTDVGEKRAGFYLQGHFWRSRGKSEGRVLAAIWKGPGVRQRSRMVGCLADISIKLVMNNPFYSFNNEIRKESKDGGIGISLTENLENF